MRRISTWLHEANHQWHDRTLRLWILLTLLLACGSVVSGMLEVADQRQTISRLLKSDSVDRLDATSQQQDWGGLAYYSFHFTYDAPSDFAFAAMGVRDQEPWKHRVRMLALEGQIYERDAGNPVLALIGRFDFSFFAAFVVPLILIVLLHDLHAAERSAGRHALLMATAYRPSHLWRQRALLRCVAVFLAMVLPLIVGALLSNTPSHILVWAVLSLAAYVGFWGALVYRLSRWSVPATTTLATLIGMWVLLAVAAPALVKVGIDKAVPLPDGAEILLTQRENVNAAWDKPKSETMAAFTAEHPAWADKSHISKPFEWKWYYAFQQVGDQSAEPLSRAFREGRQRRDEWAAMAAWLMPPVLLERYFQSLAGTNLSAHMAYETRVRAFHHRLREFYYDKLFNDQPFDEAAIEGRPDFASTIGDPASTLAVE